MQVENPKITPKILKCTNKPTSIVIKKEFENWLFTRTYLFAGEQLVLSAVDSS
jgi:hypothetical protein